MSDDEWAPSYQAAVTSLGPPIFGLPAAWIGDRKVTGHGGMPASRVTLAHRAPDGTELAVTTALDSRAADTGTLLHRWFFHWIQTRRPVEFPLSFEISKRATLIRIDDVATELVVLGDEFSWIGWTATEGRTIILGPTGFPPDGLSLETVDVKGRYSFPPF